MVSPRLVLSRRVRTGLALLGLLASAALVASLPAPAYASAQVCNTPELAQLVGQDCTAPIARIYDVNAAPNGGLDLDDGEETTSSYVELYMSTKAADPDRYQVTFTCTLTRNGTTVGEAAQDCTIPPSPGCGEENEPASCDHARGYISFDDLVPGDYVLTARAKDAAVDKLVLGSSAPNEQTADDPASRFGFKVVEPTNDTTAPNTRFTSTPKRWHLSPFAAEEYAADEPLKSAVCLLQGGARECDRSQAALRVTSGDWTFSVAGVDYAGNRDRTPAVNRFTVPVPSNKLRAAGGWSKGGGPSYFFGGYSTTKKKGATLSAARAGTRSVALVATKCPGCGTVTVSYGSKVLKKVSLASSSKRYRQLIPITSWATAHGGRVTVKVVSSGKPVTIEGLGFSRRR